MAVKKEADQNSALIVETKRIKKGGLFKQILSTVLSGLLVIIFVLLTELFQSVFFLYSKNWNFSPYWDLMKML